MSKAKETEEAKDETVAMADEGLENAQVDAGADRGADSSTDQNADLEAQLVQAQQEAADLKDRMLRLAADYENYKKRNERERATAMKYAGEHIFREILPVVDNLERAITQGVVDGADAEKNLTGLLEGVQLTLKSLVASLEKFEVKPIESVGEPFDPNKQEALTMEPSEEVPANHVLTEFEKGYFYKDRLLRAAKVVVSSGKVEG